MRTFLLALIHCYQWCLRPLLPPSCRFHPSCSCYAQQALKTHGAWRGTKLTASRILRCHPWNAGGYDPVPLKSEPNASIRSTFSNTRSI